MNRFTILVITLILCAISGNVFGITASANHQVQIVVAEIAAMALSDATLLSLSTTDPALPGGNPQGSIDSARYLRYTTLNTTGTNRKIQASLSAGAPAGTALKLTAAMVGGGYGTSAGQVTLSASAQDLVTVIGSGATGSAGINGANLQYVLAVVTPTSLVIGSTTVTITFTLTEDL